jgi:polysaccharide chain length determinant protein (PEP-CTERM system associated)
MNRMADGGSPMEPDVPSGGSLISQSRAVWRRRKWLALLVLATVATGALTLVYSLPDLYRGTATVLVERHAVPDSFVKSAITSELETRLQTVNQQILSRNRLEVLAEQLGLYPELRQRGSAQAVADRFRHDVTLELKSVDRRNSQEPTTIAFAISYRGRDPRTVATVANTLASFYITENRASRQQQAVAMAALLKTQLDETKRHLEGIERTIGEFRQRHLGELPQQAVANAVTLERLHADLRYAMDGQSRAAERRQAALQQLADLAATPTGIGADSPAALLVRKRAELARLRTEYTDRYPDIVRLREEIGLLERQVAERSEAASAHPPEAVPPSIRRLQQSVSQADADIRSLKDEEARLRVSIADYQRRVDLAPRREQELGELTRDYEATKELYRSLLGRHEEAVIGRTMETQSAGEVFRLVESAMPPEQPVAPNRLPLAVLGVIAALGLACGAVVLAEQLDSSFHSPEALRAFTTVPVVAAIPLIDTETDRRARRRRFRLAAASALIGLAVISGMAHLVARGNDQIVTLLARKPAS